MSNCLLSQYVYDTWPRTWSNLLLLMLLIRNPFNIFSTRIGAGSNHSSILFIDLRLPVILLPFVPFSLHGAY